MKIGALVPARTKSSRLPGKNFMELNGKPLICWTVDKLLEADAFDDITISTDSEEGVEQARALYPGKEVTVVLRPEALCTYDTSLNACITHHLQQHPEIDALGQFMPTYPFRDLAKLRAIDRHLRSRYVWNVTGVSDQKYTTSDYYYPVEGGYKKLFDHRPMQYPIYTSNYTYFQRHALGALRTKYCLTNDERMLHVNSSYEECIDIDTRQDFCLAEKIAAGGKIVGKAGREYVYKDWTIYAPDGLDIDAFIDYVGREKFDDTTYPLVTLKRVEHAFARYLQFRLFAGRSIFMNLDSYTHVYPAQANDSHLTQTFPPEYRATPMYRLLRTDHTEKFGSSASDYPDNHGVNFGGLFNDVNSSEFFTAENGHILGPDTLSPERAIVWEDLSKQEFFIDPEEVIHA